MRTNSRNSWGFTLIELMITVAIVGILATIAYPSYRQQVLKSNRIDAKVALMQNSQNLEKYFTVNGTYMGFTASPSDHGYYTISLPTLTPSQYIIKAVATGSQISDTSCATFTIDQTGAKTPTAGCW